MPKITPEEVEALLSQNPNCMICGSTKDADRLTCSVPCTHKFTEHVARLASKSGIDFEEALQLFQQVFERNRPV